MIQSLLKYAHYCENGHLNCSNDQNIEKCFFTIEEKQCGANIERTYTLPSFLEFKQVYNKDVFDAIMFGHEMSEFIYTVHKNLAILNETMELVCKKLGIKSKLGDIR